MASAHLSAGGRNVASATYGPVDEISPKAEVFADPQYNFQGFTEWGPSQRPDVAKPPSNPSSNFQTNSTTFLHLLTQHQRDVDPTAVNGVHEGPGFHMALNKAVSAYETIAEVISNPRRKLGGSYSATL
ncbi:MAG: hypothetical protein OQK24_08995 [Magnetovibrio sp.]|nr:hypothetical protein [Magnetovibrio sp.]